MAAFQTCVGSNWTGPARALIRAIFGAILLTVFSVTANAACTGSLPKTLTNNTIANADDVMLNFTYLHDYCGSSGGQSLWALSGSTISYTAGNVGVGTTNPTHTLEVNGSLNVSGAITCGSGCGGGGGGASQWTTGGSSIYFSTGNVGIGTTSPAYTLEVAGNAQFGNSLGHQGTVVVGGDGNGGFIRGIVPGNLTIQAATYPIMTLAQGGGVNIGTTLTYNSGSAHAGGLNVEGAVGIGTTSPSYMLHVNGTAYATGAAGALSDIRDKKDIAPLSISALDTVLKLRPVTFAWKEAKDDGMKGRQMGLIAQEVEKVLPSAILTASDKRKSKAIKYNELTTILIKAVQEQQMEIQELRLANNKLEARLASIERVRPAKK